MLTSLWIARNTTRRWREPGPDGTASVGWLAAGPRVPWPGIPLRSSTPVASSSIAATRIRWCSARAGQSSISRLRVFRVITPGRVLPPYPKRVAPVITVSREYLRQAEGEDAVAPLKALKEAVPTLPTNAVIINLLLISSLCGANWRG